MEKLNEELLARARQAIRANYDGTTWNQTVGAAIRCTDGSIYVGVNLYSVHSVCAEQVALGAAITDGKRSFDTIVAVRGKEGEELLPPCGNCRQILADLAPGIRVLVSTPTGVSSVPIGELLPFSYEEPKL